MSKGLQNKLLQTALQIIEQVEPWGNLN